MSVFQTVALILTALGGVGVVTCREPPKQAIMVSLYGLVLGALFLAFQAPDVALSEIVVGAVVIPMLLMLTIAKIRRAG
jgi:uncharacterized MnhB-related membrane protein